MRARLSARWYDVQDSLWFIPSLMTAAAIVLAQVMIRIDHAWIGNRRSESDWLFGAGASGAREVLSAIAGTMITVTGVVFSITIVALQLASGQFTPRVLRTFTGDRGNQMVLGVFIATFTYSLLVLRTVQEAPGESGTPFVPSASVTLAIGLALVSIGFLIFYIDHAATSIRASVVIDRAAQDALGLIDHLFPATVGRPAAPAPGWSPTDAPASVRISAGGYLQTIDADALFGLAEDRTLTVRIDVAVGEYVLPGATVASIWPAASLDEEMGSIVRQALILGSERTLQADLDLGIGQLADIAVRALSPGVNDPTTAMTCVDRLAEALVTLARRPRPAGIRAGADGHVRVVLPVLPFDGLVAVAFGQIRHFGAGDAVVAAHLARTLGKMTASVPEPRRAALRRQGRLVVESARDQITIPADLAEVEAVGRWAEIDAG